MIAHTDKSPENKRQTAANELSKKQGGGESALQSVENHPGAIQMQSLQEMADNSSRVSQLKVIQKMMSNSGVIQLEWGDDHTPAQILLLLTGKSVEDFENHRGEAFSVISNSKSSLGGAIVLGRPNSTTHLTIPYTRNVEQKKYEKRETPHMTGLFNSGTEEAPEMTEWSQEYDISGKATKNAEPRIRDDQRYVRRKSLKEGEFLLASKVKSTGERRPAAVGGGGERFIRRPSIESLNLDKDHLPSRAEDHPVSSVEEHIPIRTDLLHVVRHLNTISLSFNLKSGQKSPMPNEILPILALALQYAHSLYQRLDAIDYTGLALMHETIGVLEDWKQRSIGELSFSKEELDYQLGRFRRFLDTMR